MAKRNTLINQDKYCNFCVNKHLVVDYKNTDLLRKYISSFGKIVPRKRSGLCSKHQRKMAAEIKRSRVMALLPFVLK